jgi:hypothetical protein
MMVGFLVLCSAGQPADEEIQADEDAVLLIEGSTAMLSSIVLCSCATEPVCIWTDSANVPVAPPDDPPGWTSGGPPSYPTAMDVAAAVEHAAARTTESKSPSNLIRGNGPDEPVPATLDVPVFVLNQPERADRAGSAEAVIRAAGVGKLVTFLPFTRAGNVDIAYLQKQGILDRAGIDRMNNASWIGTGAIVMYLAAALDHLGAIRAGYEAGFELFGVFEDDVMLAARPEAVRDRLSGALRNVPEGADMLYLEGCFEACGKRRFSRAYPHWARTEGLACSAAIIFTRKGARRVLQLCRTVFWGIDTMYQVIETGPYRSDDFLWPHGRRCKYVSWKPKRHVENIT